MMELYSGYLEDHFNLHKLSSASPPQYMTPAASPAQFAPAPLRMGYGRPAPVMGMWSSEPFKVDSGGHATCSASTVMEADTKLETSRLQDVPQVALEPERSTDQETSRPPERVMRRLAQNREAARKSRLRKKVATRSFGLHPAARDKPDEAGPARAGASTGSTAAGRVRKWEHGRPSSRIHRVDRSRRRRVRDRIQALGGRAEAAHGGADVGAPGAADVGAGAPLAGGDGAQQLRAPLQDQGAGRQRGRVPRHVGRVEDPRREVLPLDRRVQAVGGPKDSEPAAGAAGGGAAHARGRPPAHVNAGGGRAVAGHGEATAEPRRDPDRRG
uniref:BZIP domain-containing protein n=1 Tax=Zea mays TaxID=4577 RepID=A0A804M9P7_MAIZE